MEGGPMLVAVVAGPKTYNLTLWESWSLTVNVELLRYYFKREGSPLYPHESPIQFKVRATTTWWSSFWQTVNGRAYYLV